MNHFKLKTLIKEAVRNELKSLLEKKDNARQWQDGDKITLQKLDSVFNVFHLSTDYLGPIFSFTPRVPLDTFMSVFDGTTTEDDFTSRVSLAPSVKKANAAVPNKRRFIYAGDIEGYSGDEVDTFDLAKHLPDCPSSSGNKYGEKFSLTAWIQAQFEKTLHPATRKSLLQVADSAQRRDVGPKHLPNSLKKQFQGCVPDAASTKELWSLSPVRLLNVAEAKNSGYYLTEVGAEVFNAIDNNIGTIPYE